MQLRHRLGRWRSCTKQKRRAYPLHYVAYPLKARTRRRPSNKPERCSSASFLTASPFYVPTIAIINSTVLYYKRVHPISFWYSSKSGRGPIYSTWFTRQSKKDTRKNKPAHEPKECGASHLKHQQHNGQSPFG